MNEFKPGDVIELKSGGPEMTVDQVAKDGLGHTMVWCDWFDGSKKITATFPPTSLKGSK